MKTFLQVESAAIMVAFAGLWFLLDYPLWLFALLFFAPDLSFFAYLFGSRSGAIVYNAVHNYGTAFGLIGFGYFLGFDAALMVGIAMASHIGFDRMLGYGLKHFDGFKHTHLGRL